MVAPIYIIAISLGIAFLIGIFRKSNKNVSGMLMLLALACMSFISAQWFISFMTSTQSPEYIYTAGFKPPFSINLLMGLNESFFTLIINLAAFLGAIYLYNDLKKQGTNAMSVFLGFAMALNVMVMTRDIFNLYVFLEIVSVATAGLIILDKGLKSTSAGFKYMIATGIISSLLLIGIVFAYNYSGTLNIDGLINANIGVLKGGAIAIFLILIAIVLELKPFPANGWALDVYQAANPGITALISAASASASFYVLYKLLPIAGEAWYPVIAVLGIITFFSSNLLGIKQTNSKRLLGYSSIGQIGLLLTVLGLSPHLGNNFKFIIFGLLISHYFAKAGLFWLSGIIKTENIRDWAAIRKKPFLLFFMGTFIFALVGFPPFPSFFAKWQLIMSLSNVGMYGWVVAILLGSLFEGVYLFRWFGYAMKLDNEKLPSFKVPANKIIPVALFALSIYVVGYFSSSMIEGGSTINYIPLFFVAFLFLIDFLPVIIKNSIAIAGVAYYAYNLLPSLYDDKLRFIFGVIFLIGGIILLIPGYSQKGKRKGFYPFVILMYAGLIGLIEASNILQFFFAWELMTMGSYILIIRGKKSMPHGYSYMLFSIGGAYAILAGLGIAHAGQALLSLNILSTVTMYAPWVYVLLAIGFMTKTAAVGFHIWLPGAHAEAESDVSPMVSAILLKAGVFGFVVLMLAMRTQSNIYPIAYALGWLGAITALVGNLKASFQEDAKRLLAWSSIGQLGYILFALAFMTNLGWLTAMTYSINHFLYKSLLFLAIGGVVLRVRTHNMYEMGGLIKRMPFSFVAVLIGIIALAGIPPLSGFAGKWLFYNAIVLKGWYLQGVIMFFSGIIAFLYCFQLINSVFLGQLKDKHRHVKEASIWFLIPEYILIAGIMFFSVKPGVILKPIGDYLAQYFPNNVLHWVGNTAYSPLGYWNATAIIQVVGVMFVVLILWLLLVNRRNTKIKQFNMVYAGERPFRPELTHNAYNLYSGYYKGVWFFVIPWVTYCWDSIADFTKASSDFLRRIYNGNGQSYAMHIILFVATVYFLLF
ncbi:MAG: NADH-quinone oxidoreductase subunit F [Bacteroidetes bacterium]|nr:MAG: NADH-quinone oxidoreductase subunit F [Bacteroidota bacterium]